MAKNKEGERTSSGKMTVMLIQLEGDNATLQEGIRTFKEAMGRAIPQPAPRPQLLPASLAAIATAPPAECNGDGHANGDVEEYVGDTADRDPGASASAPPSRPTKDRKFPVMDFVNDLNLHPKDKTSLKAFVQEKKPANQLEKITVCLHYLCHTLDVKGITANHVYTCLKDIAAKTPNDLRQTMRTIAKRKGYIDASNGDDLKITNPGDNFVEHDLPRGGT